MNKILKRSILLLAMIMIISMTFSACFGDEDTDDDDDDYTPSESTAESVESSTPAVITPTESEPEESTPSPDESEPVESTPMPNESEPTEESTPTPNESKPVESAPTPGESESVESTPVPNEPETSVHECEGIEWVIVKEATCTETGTKNLVCSCFNVLYTDIIPIKPHTEETVKGKDATCTETGLTDGTKCSVCGKKLVEQTVISLKAHTYDNEYDESCNVCGFVRDADCKHSDQITVVGKAATCTATGLTDGKKCSVCGKTLVEQTVIPMKSHTEETVKGKKATCTETGLTDGKKCSVCGKILVERKEVAALGHDEIDHAAKAPTCTEIGWDAYVTCSRCDYTTYKEIPVAHNMKDGMCTRCYYPYIGISNAEEFKNISSNLEGKYILLNDIDFGGAEWTSIGDEDYPFVGIFDGNGYVISNFKITESIEYVGLFGYNSATIKNLGVENFTIDVSSGYAGGLVCYNVGGTITNCYAAGDVSSRYAGGLVGYNDGTITNCYATGNVTSTSSGQSCAGGLVGDNRVGSITNCYAAGFVSANSDSGDSYAGGLVGNNGGIIENCYATGDVSSSGSDYSYAGGLVGDNGGIIGNCYATGDVSSSGSDYSYAGGLVGYNVKKYIENCCATGDVSSSCDSISCAGGLVGYIFEGTVTNCYAMGDVSSSCDSISYAGGLVGYSLVGIISNCYRYNGQKFTVIENGTTTYEATNTEGTEKEMSELQSVAFQTSTLGWSADDWTFVEGEHPTLKNVGTTN